MIDIFHLFPYLLKIVLHIKQFIPVLKLMKFINTSYVKMKLASINGENLNLVNKFNYMNKLKKTRLNPIMENY